MTKNSINEVIKILCNLRKGKAELCSVLKDLRDSELEYLITYTSELASDVRAEVERRARKSVMGDSDCNCFFTNGTSMAIINSYGIEHDKCCIDYVEYVFDDNWRYIGTSKCQVRVSRELGSIEKELKWTPITDEKFADVVREGISPRMKER